MSNEIINNSFDEVAKMINEFHSVELTGDSLLKLFAGICKNFGFDTSSIITYEESSGKYLTMYKFDKEKGLKDYTKQLNTSIELCINVLKRNTSESQESFEKLYNEQNYIYTDKFDEIKTILEDVGFSDDNADYIKEVLVFSNSSSALFSYSIFVKYSDKKISTSELNMMTALCRIINSNIKIMIEKKTLIDDILMKDTILYYEEIPIAVVEKESFRILYHNDFYYNVFPTIEVGGLCYELMGQSQKCAECCMDKDILISVKDSEYQWTKKSILFEMSNGKEAYLIYAKDNADYVKQLTAVDKLTGSLLFKGFEEYYKNFIRRSSGNYALCTIDIDKFKYINSLFGYETGDDVLKKVANVIRKFIENHENFCRVGEDKFSAFLQYEDEVHLHSKVKDLADKFIAMKEIHFPDIRIIIIGGVTIVNKELNIYNLLDQSTTARKSIKGSHRSNFSYYDPKLDSKIQKDIRIEEMVPYALTNDEFVPYLQPKFNLETREICGAEALVRWETTTDLIYPDSFIPLFEQNGFILTLDFIMYEKVMQFIRKCIDKNLKVYPISVNVSRNHIKDKQFLGKFLKLIKKYRIPHEYLELEITESVFIEDKRVLIEFIDAIKLQNLKVSIDDFGTAYSSLQTLTDINIDVLKIDKGFLDNIVIDDDSSAEKHEILLKNIVLIKNIINLAKELDFKVVCEGVETDGQIELLKSIGCEIGQGFAFAKPMPISHYTKKYLG